MDEQSTMTVKEAINKLIRYNRCLEVALNLGHGTAESAEVCEALTVVINAYTELDRFISKQLNQSNIRSV